jgi:hypothetical protein
MFDAVDVVYLVRLLTVRINPRKPMRFVFFAVYLNKPVSAAAHSAG